MLNTFSFSINLMGEFDSLFKDTLKKIPFKPNLALAFVSVSLKIPVIMDAFSESGISLIGCTTAGEILFDKERDLVSEKGGVFILMETTKEYLDIGIVDALSSDFKTGRAVGDLINNAFTNSSALIFSSGILRDGTALTKGINDTLDKTTRVFGAMAGDDLNFKKSFVFTEKKISEDGIAYLVFNSDKIEINGMTVCGWQGIGAGFIISKTDGNYIYEINNKPALDFIVEYLNISEDDLPLSSLEYSFMIKDESIPQTFRIITGYNKEKKYLVTSGRIKEGEKVSFSVSSGFSILSKTREETMRFYEKHSNADLLFLFSSVSRNVSLGPLVTTEIKLAPLKWKTPLIGMFSYGEWGTVEETKKPIFYNQSFTLVTIKEINP